MWPAYRHIDAECFLDWPHGRNCPLRCHPCLSICGAEWEGRVPQISRRQARCSGSHGAVFGFESRRSFGWKGRNSAECVRSEIAGQVKSAKRLRPKRLSCETPNVAPFSRTWICSDCIWCRRCEGPFQRLPFRECVEGVCFASGVPLVSGVPTPIISRR